MSAGSLIHIFTGFNDAHKDMLLNVRLLNHLFLFFAF